jgi:hypothetical protein
VITEAWDLFTAGAAAYALWRMCLLTEDVIMWMFFRRKEKNSG